MYKKISAMFKITLFAITFLFSGNAIAKNIQDQNKALLAKFAEKVFVAKDLSGLDKYMHTNYVQHSPFVEQGIIGFRDFFKNWFENVPDFNYTLKKIIADEEHVWIYGTYAGTHKGDWLGIPATNKKYSIDAIDIFRIEQGKLAEHWDVIDIYSLFKQLGTIQ